MVSFAPENVYHRILLGLRGLGYHGGLIEEAYEFRDWFSSSLEERRLAAVAFGQTPISYDSACIGVAYANRVRGADLINEYRSLGAPAILEIDHDEVREWAVSRREGEHGLVDRYPFNRIDHLFVNRAPDWKPEALLRAKNIGSFRWAPQLGLFTGLLPELEEHIEENLDPLLRETLSATKSAYRQSAGRNPDPDQMFKLVFWLLTAKVFHDRRVNGFATITPDPDVLLAAVAKQYRTVPPRLLNQEAREAAASRIWAELDFRNLSVEVLSQIWSTTLVDDTVKRRLGIHRTPRTIVRYVIERIPFEQSGDDERIVLEPCCGGGVFLIGAMNQLRQNLFGATPAERHRYFVRHLAGIEKDPFGVEISRLALTLADFPHPGDWDIVKGDVFQSGGPLSKYLRRAGVVLCNPPFRDFDKDERREYKQSSIKKPVELLNRVLNDLHPSGVLGFVLPRIVVDGRGYADIRKRLTERFANIELTVLPDRAFEADPEVGLLIATEPIPHKVSRVAHRHVNDDEEAWQEFELAHKVSSDHVTEFSPDQAQQGLAIPQLPEVWDFLINYPVMEEVAYLHRGIEWNRPLTKHGRETGHRVRLVRSEEASGYWPGVAPRARFAVFERPDVKFLSMRPEDQRGSACKEDWKKPKAIVNKSTRSRGPWRMAAFPDTEGLTCYQTYIGVWPRSSAYDEWLLSAILNSPVANAFVATREGKTDITMETIARIPVPHFTDAPAAKLRALIQWYQRAASAPIVRTGDDPERLLKEIDALVLAGYRMPPRVERRLLEFFRDQPRPASHGFGNYLPKNCDVYFSLSEHLSDDFAATTTGAYLKRMAEG